MAETRNLCAHIPLTLHSQVCAAKDAAGQTLSEYITNLLTEYYQMKENGGNKVMATNSRTMAFQIPEELFQRIKAHLERETARTGHKLTQREFVLGLIEDALAKAECEAAVSPCDAREDSGSPQPQEEDNPAASGEEQAE